MTIYTTSDEFEIGHHLLGTNGERISVTCCNRCGSVVLKLDHHRKHCPVQQTALELNESVMAHMLADLDQIITEMEMNPERFSRLEWVAKLRRAVDGEDYKL